MSEAIRYLNNAKEILRRTPIEDTIYADIKPVQEACSTAYLAVLKAIKKYIAVHNGKLTKEFEVLYDELHIAGYYRGLHLNANIIKEIFKAARSFIDKTH